MISADYIVGLVDGEGSFCVHVWTPNSSLKRRALVELRFYLKLIDRDKVVLEELQNFFQCGKIYQQKDFRKNHQHCNRFEVFNRSELATTIVPFFEKHSLQTVSKQKDFVLFSQVLKLVQAKEHLTEPGLTKIRTLKDQMH